MYDFLFWGMFGITCEVGFTSLRDLLQNKKFNLMGHTSFWMFPIYAVGLTYGFELIRYLLPNDIIRWLSYPLWIWLLEIIVGLSTAKLGIKLWDYSWLPEKLHWKGIFSFAHFPIWVLFGIMVEAIQFY